MNVKWSHPGEYTDLRRLMEAVLKLRLRVASLEKRVASLEKVQLEALRPSFCVAELLGFVQD